MSKTFRRNRPVKIQEVPPLLLRKKLRGQPVFIVVIAILAAIPFSMGKYLELSSPDPFDSGANVYSAEHILSGAKIGVEEKQSASIGTLLVNILGVWLFGYNDFGPKLMQGILQAAALILMFIAMRKLFGTLPAAVSVIVTSYYISAPVISQLGNDKMQYTVAAMVLSMSCFVLRQLDGKWWYAVLAGAFAIWAPLFKQTGTSVIGAIGIFIVLQPFLKHRTWKQTGTDILLLSAGAVAAVAPLYIWIIGWNVQMGLPYLFVWQTVTMLLPIGTGGEQAKSGLDYVATARTFVPFSRQWPTVLRYYWLLRLPIALAMGSLVARIVRIIQQLKITNLHRTPNGGKSEIENRYDRFVLLFAVWWVLDMAFVWISAHSYEQYYLPINASGAMLGGYLIAVYRDKAKTAVSKPRWAAIGAVGLLLMIILAWHIFFGIEKSPYSGQSYGEKTRGYIQRLKEVSQHPQYPWEIVGDYIRTHSEPADKIYVWGWFPGIYVRAQRFSSASNAFCMTREPPQRLAQIVTELLSEFKQEMPKFIVDSRKRHVPTERPPYELWPIVPKGFMGAEQSGFLPLNKDIIEAYDKQWTELLRTTFDEDEALRYGVLKPFREFVMKNYRIVQVFGQHVLFELKSSPEDKKIQ